DVVANADARFSIQEVTHTDLSQVVTALLVVTPLGQRITLIGTGNPGEEVGCVIGEHTLAEQMFFLPHSEQTRLCLFQFIVSCFFHPDAFKAIPKVLRAEALAWQTPEGR